MNCPAFTALFEREPQALAHARDCANCTQALTAIEVVRKAPQGSGAFRQQVLSRLHERQTPRWMWLAPAIAACAAIVLFVQTPEFMARGGAQQPISVEPVPSGEGYGVRVKNLTDNDVWIGAYLKDAAGEVHWIAPHYPQGAPAPQLVRVPAGTQLHLLDVGVIPDRPAPGSAELIGFAQSAPAQVETPMPSPLFETRQLIEVR